MNAERSLASAGEVNAGTRSAATCASVRQVINWTSQRGCVSVSVRVYSIFHDSLCLNSQNRLTRSKISSGVFQLWNSEATGNYNTNNNNTFISALESKVKLRSVVFTSNNDPETVVGSLLGCHLLDVVCGQYFRDDVMMILSYFNRIYHC